MAQPTKNSNNTVGAKMLNPEIVRFRQMNIVREIDNLGQAYLLLSVFEKIKIIAENHNKEVNENLFLSWFRGILNRAIAEIDEEIFKLKPRNLRNWTVRSSQLEEKY
jgi:hypothetical protein